MFEVPPEALCASLSRFLVAHDSTVWFKDDRGPDGGRNERGGDDEDDHDFTASARAASMASAKL